MFYFLSQYSFHDRSSEGILNLTPPPPPPALPPFNRGLLGGSSRAILLKSCKAVFDIQEIQDRYNMITVSGNKTKRLVLLARTRAHICSRFIREKGSWVSYRLSPWVILTAQIQVPVKVEPYFRCILNSIQEKQVYIASGEHVQPQQNWDAIYSARTLVIVSFHCAKYA